MKTSVLLGWIAGIALLLILTAVAAKLLFHKPLLSERATSPGDFFAILARDQWNILHQPSTIQAGSVINYESPGAPVVVASVNDCVAPPIRMKHDDPQMDLYSNRSFNIDTKAATKLLNNAGVALAGQADSAASAQIHLKNVQVEAIEPTQVQAWCLTHKHADKISKQCQNTCDPTADFPLVSEVIRAQMVVNFLNSSGAKLDVDAAKAGKTGMDSGYTLNSDGGLETKSIVPIAYRVGMFFPFVLQSPKEGQQFGCRDRQIDVSGTVFVGNHHIYLLSRRDGQNDWISEGEATLTSDGRWDGFVDLAGRTPPLDGGFAVIVISSIEQQKLPAGTKVPPSAIPAGDHVGSQAIHVVRSCPANQT